MGSYKDMNDKKVLDGLNAGLAEDYKLNLLTGAETGNITSTNGVPADADLYFIAKSDKTDAWDNPYYVVFDTQDRNGLVSPISSSRLFLLVLTPRLPSTEKLAARTIPRRMTCSSWFSIPTAM